MVNIYNLLQYAKNWNTTPVCKNRDKGKEKINIFRICKSQNMFEYVCIKMTESVKNQQRIWQLPLSLSSVWKMRFVVSDYYKVGVSCFCVFSQQGSWNNNHCNVYAALNEDNNWCHIKQEQRFICMTSIMELLLLPSPQRQKVCVRVGFVYPESYGPPLTSS